jgi:hypothetical protein
MYFFKVVSLFYVIEDFFSKALFYANVFFFSILRKRRTFLRDLPNANEEPFAAYRISSNTSPPLV